MDAVTYQAGLAPVNYVTGRYLAHNHLDRVSKAFLASDLISASKQLVKPTILQAAMLAKVNSTYAWWATRRARTASKSSARICPWCRRPCRRRSPIPRLSTSSAA